MEIVMIGMIHNMKGLKLNASELNQKVQIKY